MKLDPRIFALARREVAPSTARSAAVALTSAEVDGKRATVSVARSHRAGCGSRPVRERRLFRRASISQPHIYYVGR
jgi:hypothetical protein